jgi:Type II CAAX prenyl endopeptidase Rce1-like
MERADTWCVRPLTNLVPEPTVSPETQVARVSERLTARDARVLLLWLLAALVGAGVAYRYFFRAFPEAAVNFKVTRGEALQRAQAFVTQQGNSLAGYQSTIIFSVDDEAKTYLEREVGLAEANRLMSSSVTVWYWDARFFKPLQQEEFHVFVAPGGRVVGYDHVLPDAAPGARLTRTEALARAEQFLRDTLHTPLMNYTFLPAEANSVLRPNRTDWSFTWERTGFRVKDAPYRLRVTLQGDRIGGYEEFLQVPEAWERSFARLRSANNFIETLALLPYALLLGAALSVVLALGRQGLAHWSGALRLGLFITALYFVMQMNQWPLTRAGYDTNRSYASFVASQMGSALGLSILLALLVVIAVVPGEPLYRLGQPERLRLGSLFTLPGLRTKEFFCSGVIGLCLAGAHIGYLVLFYVIGRRLGIWAPQDLQYSNTLSTALPWVYPLTIGIYAAASEELLFRLFAVRFLLRTTKSRVLAVVLPAFAWGFLHSNYPQEPPYIRGIEVGLIGIVAGVVLLRWGILATLTWHYTVDASLISLSLMRSPDLYSRVSGTLVGCGALIPVGIAGALYLARGGFADPSALLNRAKPLVEAPPVAYPVAIRQPAKYTSMGPRAMALLLVSGVLGTVLLWAVHPKKIGDFVRFSIDARQAEARADEVLRQRGVKVGDYRRAATIQYTFNPLVNEYLRRTIGIEAANRIYRERVPSAFWTVRYFRDSRTEEYLVVLRTDGELHAVHHTLAEAAPGANLTKQEAQARAEAFLKQTKGLDLAQWRLVTSESEKRPARTDHTFIWEQRAPLNPAPDAEAAHVRVQIQVQGQEVSGYRIFIHLPEDWVRRQTESTLAGTMKAIGLIVLLAAFGIAVLVVFFRNLKQPAMAAVPWRRIAKWSLAVLIAAAAGFATMAPQYLSAYHTDLPFRIYAATVVIVLSLGAVLFFSAVFFLLGLAWFFLARICGAEQMPGWRGMSATYYRDAFVVGLAGCATILGLLRLPELAARLWPVPRQALAAGVPAGLDFSPPALHALANAVTHSFAAIGILALALGFASCYLRRTWLQALLLAALAVLIQPLSGSAGEFLESALTGLAILAVIWWGARCVVRFNLLGYFLAAMLVLLAPAATELLRQPNQFFRINGEVLAGAAAVLLLWPLVAWLAVMRAGRGARSGVPAG